MSDHRRWLNRTVLGIGIASFFSDLSHETATAILPMFLAGIGAAPAALGIIEGTADAISSFSKLASGWYSDRLTRRKPLAVTGYLITGLATTAFALAGTWWHVLFGRTLAWFGRGVRGPVRDAIMTDSIPQEARGRAFGFERTLDTLGAVLGPLCALALVASFSYRSIFFLALIPGILSALSFLFLVREPLRSLPPAAHPPLRFLASLRGLPPSFRRYLAAVGVFGVGDFAHTLLILRATDILTQAGEADAAQQAVSLYVIHNIVYAGFSYPAGMVGDTLGKRPVLALGYGLSGVMCLGFIFAPGEYWVLALLFSLGGIYIAIQDALERAVAADILPSHLRGTGFGALATVNGIGDFISSIAVGVLWSAVSATAGFVFAALFSVLGMVFLLSLRTNDLNEPHKMAA